VFVKLDQINEQNGILSKTFQKRTDPKPCQQ